MEISKERLWQLEKYEKTMIALQAAGVDNWEGYDNAVSEITKEDDIYDAIANFSSDVESVLSSNATGSFQSDPRAGVSVEFNHDSSDIEKLAFDLIKEIQEIKER